MKVLITPSGNVNWLNTRRSVIASNKFAPSSGNFGIGPEPQVLCPGCGRTLPTALMHLDHILSRANHTQQLGQAGQAVAVHDSNFPHLVSRHYVAMLSGGTVTIAKIIQQGQPPAGQRHSERIAANSQPSTSGTVQVINTSQTWENDLDNLQFLCLLCNTSKGNRSFADVFPGRMPQQLATRLNG